jgi:hypothetical protein
MGLASGFLASRGIIRKLDSGVIEMPVMTGYIGASSFILSNNYYNSRDTVESDVVDYYRQFYMHYYRWIDSGDGRSAAQYKLALGQFKAVVKYHEDKYHGNLNTLEMDFEETKSGIRLAENTPRAIRWARVIPVIALFLLVMGIPGFVRDKGHRKFSGALYFDAIFRPHRITDMDAWHSTRRMVLLFLTLYLLSLIVFSSFTSLVFPLIFGSLGLVFIAVLALLMNAPRKLDRIMVTLLAPKVLIMSAILIVVAIRGPIFFWYNVWVSDLFVMIFLSAYFMLIFRKFQVYVIMGRKWGHRGNAGAILMVLISLGIQLLLVGLVLKFFGLEESLAALNNDLLVLPIMTHFGIPLQLPIWIIIFAAGLILISALLFLLNLRTGQRSIKPVT